MIKFLSLGFVSVLFGATLRAGTVEYSGFDGQFVIETSPESYAQLGEGSYVSLGSFDLSGDFSFNLIGTPEFDTWSEISSYYTEFGNTNIFLSDGYGVFASQALVAGIAGTPLYIVGFDATSPSGAVRMAVVGGESGAWNAPGDEPLNDYLAIDIGGAGSSVFFGTLTEVDGYGGLGAGKDISLSVIPEPTTLVLLVGAMVGCFFLRLPKRG
jgi:hypothetical protein